MDLFLCRERYKFYLFSYMEMTPRFMDTATRLLCLLTGEFYPGYKEVRSEVWSEQDKYVLLLAVKQSDIL